MIDAQAYSTAKEWSALAAHANTHRVTLYTLQASGLEAAAASAADAGPGDRLLQLSSVATIEIAEPAELALGDGRRHRRPVDLQRQRRPAGPRPHAG